MIGENFSCSFVYGASDKKERKELLIQLENIGAKIAGLWLIVGDLGQQPHLQEIESLKRWMKRSRT